jgi:DNA-binding CsgD family transcriptional regulator
LLRREAATADIDVALRLSAGMERFFHTRGFIAEGRSWIDRALLLGDDASPATRAAALGGLGVLAFVQQDVATADAALRESLHLTQGLGDAIGQARALFFLGLLATRNRDLDELKEIITTLDPLTQEIQLSTWHTASFTLKGHRARISGDAEAAARLFERSLRIYADHGFDWGAARLQGILSSIALEQNDLPRSLALRQACLRTFWEHGDVGSVGSTLIDIALVATRLGQPATAARLLGVAAGVREATGTLISGEVFHDERGPTETRARLGDEAFAAGLAAGRALSTSAGVAEALALSPTAPLQQPEAPLAVDAPRATIGLTPREREVLLALVSGKTTNRDLADALFISPKTAGHHVDNIMAKMGVNSRVAAVALATREGFH